MPAPHTSPATSTATRSGAKVVVMRTEDVRDNAEPIVSVMVDDGEILSFTPTTAVELAGMLARAATTEIAVRIRVTNSYPGATFEHIYDVTVPAPRDTDLSWTSLVPGLERVDDRCRVVGEGAAGGEVMPVDVDDGGVDRSEASYDLLDRCPGHVLEVARYG